MCHSMRYQRPRAGNSGKDLVGLGIYDKHNVRSGPDRLGPDFGASLAGPTGESQESNHNQSKKKISCY